MTSTLRRIPGSEGIPIVGQTHRLLGDAERWALEAYREYGPVYRTNVLFRRTIVFGTADALKAVLLDRDRVFSSEQGWDPYIGRFFTRGLMLLDFDEHRFHRKVMQAAFRSEALAGYVDMLLPIVDRMLERLPVGEEIDLYDVYKRMTLDIGAEVFVGMPLGPEADALNRAFIDTVAAGVAPIRAPLPFTAYRRGVRGRRVLEDWFGARVGDRRASEGRDLFSRLARATTEEDAELTDTDVVNHMIFLLMAAHDTTTSSLASMSWYLARDPEWQERLYDEVADRPFTYDRREDFPMADAAFKEAMRLHPPVPFIPRRTVTDTTLEGYDLPASTQIVASTLLVHRDPAFWTSPDTYDPARFFPDRAEHKLHSHAYAPFSGGAHTCIGMHFAGLMATAITAAVIRRFRLGAGPGQKVRIQTMPIPKPVGGLPLRLNPR
jgi:cytochrome P450